MADIRKIKLPNGNTYDIVPNLKPVVDDFSTSQRSLTANTWNDTTFSDYTLKSGGYIAIGYARMTHSGAASRVIELTNSSNSRLSLACSARTSGSGEGTVNFIGFFRLTSTISTWKLRCQCGTTGTLMESGIQIFKIGE